MTITHAKVSGEANRDPGQVGGEDWDADHVITGAFGGAAPLGIAAYSTGSDTSYAVTTTTDADLDATNLVATFTAPASGKVLVKISALANDGGNNAHFTVREGSTTKGDAYVSSAVTKAQRITGTMYVTGLAAGSHTFKAGAYVSAGTFNVYHGPVFGKVIMEIWAAEPDDSIGTARQPAGTGTGWAAPTSPGSLDDEFRTTDTSDPMAGWTTFQTPTTHDVNSTALDCYYVKKTATGASTGHVGIYKSWTPSAGQSVSCGLLDCVQSVVNYQRGGGIFIGEANPVSGKTANFWIVNNGGGPQISVTKYSSAGVFSSTDASWGSWDYWVPMCFKIVYTSSTSIGFYVSRNGVLWTPVLTGYNPGFTVGTVGLSIDTQQTSYDGEAIFDFFRSSF